MKYRYYLTQRAPSPGAQPGGFIAMKDFETRRLCVARDPLEGDQYFKAWGHVDYKEKLTEKQVEDYELKFEGLI